MSAMRNRAPRRSAAPQSEPAPFSFEKAVRKAVQARQAAQGDHADAQSRRVRLRLASLGSMLTLPIAQKALGMLEGEHHSQKAGNGFDYLDLRDYQPGDEARLIEWKASARAGRPIVINRQRDVTSTVWLLLDIGTQMKASTPSGERELDVAANVLRMIALLSLRRGDEISLVLANSAQVTRTPFSGGYAEFDQLLRQKMAAAPSAPSDAVSLLDYARRIETHDALIVLATGEQALTVRAGSAISVLSEEHPLFFAVAKGINPFGAGTSVRDIQTGRLMPAFLRGMRAANEFETRRQAAAQALDHDLDRHGDTLLWAGSSQEMLDGFIRLVRLSRLGVRPHASNMVAHAGSAGFAIGGTHA